MRSLLLATLLALATVTAFSTVEARPCSDAEGEGARQEIVAVGSTAVSVYVEDVDEACGEEYEERCDALGAPDPIVVPETRVAGMPLLPETTVDLEGVAPGVSLSEDCGPIGLDAGVAISGANLLTNPTDDYGLWFAWSVAQPLLP